MYDHVRYATPLNSAFSFPFPPLFQHISDRVEEAVPNWIYAATKYKNGLKNTGIYEQLLSYLAKELFLNPLVPNVPF